MMKFERPTDKYDAALILRNLVLILKRIDLDLVNLDDWTITVDEWELGLSKGDYSIHLVIDEWEINLIDVGFFKDDELVESYIWDMKQDYQFYCYISYLMQVASAE